MGRENGLVLPDINIYASLDGSAYALIASQVVPELSLNNGQHQLFAFSGLGMDAACISVVLDRNGIAKRK